MPRVQHSASALTLAAFAAFALLGCGGDPTQPSSSVVGAYELVRTLSGGSLPALTRAVEGDTTFLIRSQIDLRADGSVRSRSFFERRVYAGGVRVSTDTTHGFNTFRWVSDAAGTRFTTADGTQPLRLRIAGDSLISAAPALSAEAYVRSAAPYPQFSSALLPGTWSSRGCQFGTGRLRIRIDPVPVGATSTTGRVLEACGAEISAQGEPAEVTFTAPDLVVVRSPAGASFGFRYELVFVDPAVLHLSSGVSLRRE